MKLNSTRRKAWVVTSGCWLLASLALLMPIYEAMFGRGRVPLSLLAFTFLAINLAPFASVILGWISGNKIYRRVYVSLITFSCFLVAMIDLNHHSDIKIALFVTSWWLIFILSHWLLRQVDDTVLEMDAATIERDADEVLTRGRSFAKNVFRFLGALSLALIFVFVGGAIDVALSAQSVLQSNYVNIGGSIGLWLWVPTWYGLVQRRKPVWQPGRRFWIRWFWLQILAVPLAIFGLPLFAILANILLLVVFVFDSITSGKVLELTQPREVDLDARGLSG